MVMGDVNYINYSQLIQNINVINIMIQYHVYIFSGKIKFLQCDNLPAQKLRDRCE